MINSTNHNKEELMVTEEEMDNFREEAAHERKKEAALRRNPDCRDPEHPGCEVCEDQGDEDEATA